MPSRTTVCIVDDDDQICRWMARLLDGHGLRTATFDSGSRLLEAFDPDWTGCLVVDLRMPGMNGLELQDALNQRSSTMPIIMVSGAADVPMTVRAMEQGATSLLQKPLRANELLAKVHEALLLNERQRKRIARQTDARDRLARLSNEEHHALKLVLAGLGNKQLAARLAVSPTSAVPRLKCA
jgi:two-component system response regulator FixJ